MTEEAIRRWFGKRFKEVEKYKWFFKVSVRFNFQDVVFHSTSYKCSEIKNTKKQLKVQQN